MKTLAAQALELASKATEGPWYSAKGASIVEIPIADGGQCIDMTELIGPNQDGRYFELCDAEFIAQSRTLVPELARMLQLATEALKFYADKSKYENFNAEPAINLRRDAGEIARDTINQLERPL